MSSLDHSPHHGPSESLPSARVDRRARLAAVGALIAVASRSRSHADPPQPLGADADCCREADGRAVAEVSVTDRV